MKNTRIMVVVLAAVLVLGFSVTGAFAAANYYDATVTAPASGFAGAGPSGATDTFFVLTHSTTATKLFTNMLAKAYPGRGKEMLAVALSAMANSKKVRINVDMSATGTPVLQSMTMLPGPRPAA
jgi:hypothetical protein